MAFALVQAWSPNDSSGTTNSPSGSVTTAGNFLTCRVTHRTSGVTASMPTGWTLIGGAGIAAGSATQFLFVAVNASAITSTTVTFSGSVNSLAIVEEWSGAATGDAIRASDMQTRASSTGPAPITVAAQSGDLVYGTVGSAVSNRGYTLQGSAFADLFQHKSGQMTSLAAWDELASGATTGPEWDITSGSAATHGGITIAVKPAGGGDPEPVDLTSVADLTFALAIDAPAATQTHALTGADLTFAASIDSPTITQAHALSVADLTLGLTIDSPALDSAGAVTVADLALAPSIDAPALTQSSDLTVADLTFALSVDPVAVDTSTTLTVADLSFALTIDAPTLTAAPVLAVADLTLGLVADAVTLSQQSAVTVADLLLALALDSPALTVGEIGTPPHRTFTVPARPRTFTVTESSRQHDVSRDPRTFTA